MQQKGWIGDPLNVMIRDGKMESFDNRRFLAAQELDMGKVPINIVDGSTPYPKFTTGKTWNDAFDQRLRENGLGKYGTSDQPAIGKDQGKMRIAENKRNRCGC